MTITEENFITAFWQLYQDKPIEKISVRELCETAGYNRTTFYDHFKDIYDLLDVALIQILLHFEQSAFKNLSMSPDFNHILPAIIQLFKENETHIHCLILHHDYNRLETKIRNSLKTHYLQDKQLAHHQELALAYHTSAVFGLLQYWFESGQVLTETELFQLIYDITVTAQ